MILSGVVLRSRKGVGEKHRKKGGEEEREIERKREGGGAN